MCMRVSVGARVGSSAPPQPGLPLGGGGEGEAGRSPLLPAGARGSGLGAPWGASEISKQV